ncbi:hypothetical protein LK07_09285 [Streptomyces pluripotens]|uniref:Uncharacterized protein n=1 Tax=Streptomyces pluripotens TaxID=1355015 RepID=A0A221NWB6_9ACTN|nr:hypothetical protein LK06_008180 [Streptomyces pluripotens]ASN24202.1 hypothetical protein LK07_09285 [Streptomyces pluripotens]KIE22769.1 hypothetical protein LK08_33475 [Streptomyces sp. MUSC 125]
MPDALPLAPLVVKERVSVVRLHGEACFYCGVVNKSLRAAGEVLVLGGTRVWQFVTCGCQNTVGVTGSYRQDPRDRATGPGAWPT